MSISKEFFGFDDEKDPEKAPSKKKQRAAIENLGEECSKYVQGKLFVDLQQSIEKSLQTDQGWRLIIDPDDRDGQTLLFEYPNLTPRGSYIQQSVKIEMGARAEHWPVSEHEIQSYVKRALQEKVTEDAVRIRVLNIERTFWEKATILHQYAHLPEGKTLPARISRHYYDFFCLLQSPEKEKMVASHDLLDRVAKHKSIYFASAWANYEAAKKGTLRLVPPEIIQHSLIDDFKAMERMFFGKIYDWDLILETIEKFQVDFNTVT